MPSLGASRSHWPVAAWIRLRLPPPAPTVMLTGGPPPPPDPPLELLVREPVTTDPRKRIYAFEEEAEGGVVRLVWDADDPGLLEAEFRAPFYGARLPSPEVARFWKAVKERIRPLGPLPVEGADPRP
ncbi:MAG TPA: hypothetical protein VGV64_02755 [Thermoplasmata archaeon]|nr:hypothetical protein [Thermoplasmata archaeon]